PKSMEQNIKRNGLINLLALLVVGAAMFAVARFAHSLAGEVCSVFLLGGLLVAAVSWFQMRLEERERLEKLELEEMAGSKGGSALFESRAADVFPARRAREQFERFFVPLFTALLFLGQAVGAFLLWRWLGHLDLTVELKQPLVVITFFGLAAFILFLRGKFSVAVARMENHRLLRPGASWLLLNAYLCAAVAIGGILVQTGNATADWHVARGLSVLVGLIALETLVNLVLEIYRPRMKGRVARPLYESRVVALLGQPEGLITTAAEALEYQFGFKVSETWFFRLAREYLPLLILAQLAMLFLSTSFVFIDPGEQALLERFGKPVASRPLLGPGGHWKWPWPIDKVYRYRTEQIQNFNVGFTPDPMLENQETVLWTVTHTKEEN